MNNNENFCKMCGASLVGPNLVYDVELNSTYCVRCFPHERGLATTVHGDRKESDMTKVT